MVFVELNPLTISVFLDLLRVPYRRRCTPRRNRAANGTELALLDLKAHTASEQRLETNGYRLRIFIRNRCNPPVDGPRRLETGKKREICGGEGHAAAGFVPTS